VAEIEAGRREHAEAMAAVPGPLGTALRRFAGAFDRKAMPPGVRAERSIEAQQREVVPKPAKPRAKASHLPDHLLRLQREAFAEQQRNRLAAVHDHERVAA
jgi:hypothetical protein